MRVLFFGSPYFAQVALEALCRRKEFEVVGLVTQPDRAVGRGQVVQSSAIKQYAVELGIPVLQPASIKRDIQGFLTQIKEFGQIDVGVVVAFGQILPKEVLNLPSAGCINIHASLLPRWRGAAPIQRAIEAGDPKTGVCLMRMEEGLDTGPIFTEEVVTINNVETAGDLTIRLAGIGAEVLARDLERIVNGAIAARPQSEQGVLYASKILNDEARINWTLSAEVLARKVRAYNPAPGCFTTLEGRRLKIFQAEAKRPMSAGDRRPGEVVLVERQALEIQTGEGVLSLGQVQLEGKKKMEIQEFLSGTALQAGQLLGS